MRHTRYVVEMEKYDEGYDPNVQEYDPNKITSLDYKAEEGFDEQEAHDAALAAHPDYVIIGHHVEWWDD